MQKFNNLVYTRPDMEEHKSQLRAITRRIEAAACAEDVIAAIEDYTQLQSGLRTMNTLAHIRHSIDTSDGFYEGEQKFFDEALPKATPLLLGYYNALLQSPFRPQIDQRFGAHYLSIIEREAKTLSPKIMLDMIRENELGREYQKLLASCRVNFHGETLNLTGLRKYLQDPDRALRKEASEAISAFLSSRKKELDGLYDKLVKLRTRMGKKLGYENYVPLGYLNMSRTYSPEDVASFRSQVAEYLVPVCTEMHNRQAERIGVDSLKVYDEDYQFPQGNAVPLGDKDFMVNAAQKMYRELSPETGEFFDFMVKYELMDLTTKPNKRIGGYCTSMPDYQAPFIFSNFNGTDYDAKVLTHEAGHAFASVCANKAQPLPEYRHASLEACEIHSMSMEYFTHPWMELFFGPKADRYRFAHLCSALAHIPYMVCVDEFQTIVYSHPELTPAQRRAEWTKLEKIYLPDRDYDGDSFMLRGGFWQKQHHIYTRPFYYVDYALASMGAFEFYGRMQQNRAAAWQDYLTLCRAGGSRPYRELLSLANLSDPFLPGGVEKALSFGVKEMFSGKPVR